MTKIHDLQMRHRATRTLRAALAAACFLLLTSPAFATIVHYDVYDAVDTHGLWLRPLKTHLGVDDFTFQIGDAPGHFWYDEGEYLAGLTATGTNDDGATVTIVLELEDRGQGSDGEGTAGPQFGGGPMPPTSITDDWIYFDLIEGSLELNGFDDHADGTIIDITTYPDPEWTKPPQMGFYANWLDDDFGFSMWFDCPGVKSGHCGDVNVDLVERPSNPVPEPSAALLFGLGTTVVGTFTRARRRRDDD